MAQEPSGFSGFKALVSDVSDLPPVPEGAAPRPAVAAGADAGSAWVGAPPPKKRWPVGNILSALMLGGVVVVIVVLWADAPETPSNTTAATSIEEKPPLTHDKFLSRPQARYCMAQYIRIDGAKDAARETSQVEMKRLAAMVDDFNARCADTKYYSKGLPSIQKEVEAQRQKLEREGVIQLRFPVSQ